MMVDTAVVGNSLMSGLYNFNLSNSSLLIASASVFSYVKVICFVLDTIKSGVII